MSLLTSRKSLLVMSVLLFFFALSAVTVRSEMAGHIVISEIQIAGTTSSDEFVELYNPTGSVVDLTGWKLLRKTAAVDAEENLLTELAGSIPAHGFYLVAHEDYDDTVLEDDTYADENIANNNTVILRGSSDEIVDMVGMGSTNTREGDAVEAPIVNRSIERKAFPGSTPEDMAPGGEHVNLGNGEDTDNNLNDFVRHTSPVVSNPQNSGSTPETPEVSGSPPASPTDKPIASPSASLSPTITPVPTSTPTQTPEPTGTPIPTSTLSPTPTPSPSPTQSPRRILSLFAFPFRNSAKVCFIEYQTRSFGFITVTIPRINCVRVSF